MKRVKGLMALLVVMALLFACVFSTMVTYAEGEEEQEQATSETAPRTDTSGGYTGLVAHWKLDGDFKDATEFHNDGAKIGNITFADGIFGKGARFDGKSYIEVNDSDSLDLKDEFTLSLWVYKDEPKEKQGGIPYIAKMGEENQDFPYWLYEWFHLSPNTGFNNGDSTVDTSSEKLVDLQKWTLITATYDGKNLRIYNNKELGKSYLTEGSIISSSAPLYIGFAHFMTTDNYFKGVMDDVRIYNKALTYDEVGNLYDEGLKGSGKNFLDVPERMVAYYKFEGNINDLSGCSNNGTVIGTTKGISYVDGIAGKGARFNGSSYIEVKDSDSLDVDKAFTIGVWIYKEKKDGNYPIIDKYGRSRETTNMWTYKLVDWDNGDQRLELADFYTNNEENFDSGANIGFGRWYYYTASFDGKNVKIYIDGVLKQTTEYEALIPHSTGPLWIGGNTDTEFFKGIMDELRIYNYALTPAQVKNLYNMRDRLVAAPADKKTVLTALKSKQSVQLKVEALTHLFTVPGRTLPAGKDDFKRLDVTSKAVYKSSNTKVVTVSKTGMITTTGKGKATVTVTYGKLAQSISITVK